jgi:hypothetical protein
LHGKRKYVSEHWDETDRRGCGKNIMIGKDMACLFETSVSEGRQ